MVPSSSGILRTSTLSTGILSTGILSTGILSTGILRAGYAVFIVEGTKLLGSHIRLETKGTIGHFEDIFGGRNRDADISRHSREQFHLRIIEVEDGVVSDNVLNRSRIQTDLDHATAK